MELFAVIIAGGIGSRFWPRSREKNPKQLLKIFGNNTLIQDTIYRLNGLIKNENVFIITNKLHKDEIVKQLPEIPTINIITEPFGRNTSAAIGLASILIEKKSSEAVTIVLPSDHIILEKENFQTTLIKAAEFAFESNGLVTIGIPPKRPETGYGYIQINEDEIKNNIYKVVTFAEKPNYATALKFLESGDFFWNSGMFIWRVDSILNEIKTYLPDLFYGLNEIKNSVGGSNYYKTIEDVYGQLKSISIDYGIMEKSKSVYLIKGNFSWSDVGSWEEVYQLSETNHNGNAFVGKVYSDMTIDSYVYSPGKFTAVIGVENLIVINTDDGLLICRRDQSQEVKKIVDYLKHNKMNEHL